MLCLSPGLGRVSRISHGCNRGHRSDGGWRRDILEPLDKSLNVPLLPDSLLSEEPQNLRSESLHICMLLDGDAQMHGPSPVIAWIFGDSSNSPSILDFAQPQQSNAFMLCYVESCSN